MSSTQQRAALPPCLLALSPGTLVAGDGRGAEQLVQRVRAAVAGGLEGVLLREPELPDAELLALALTLTRRFEDLWVGLHDRPHLALASGARGVHLGRRSLTPQEVRSWLAPQIAIGLSTHADDDPTSWDAADYLFHGPVHPTPKPYPVQPIGLAGLASAVGRTDVPIWALGGLGPAEAPAVIEAGARGVAVLSGLLPAPDPQTAAASYAAALAGR